MKWFMMVYWLMKIHIARRWLMAKGDHIKVRRLVYSHHGIDCGDGSLSIIREPMPRRRRL
jgi:hypothetical protein